MIQLKQSSQLNSYLAQKIITPRYRPEDTIQVGKKLFDETYAFAGQKLTIEDVKQLSRALAKPIDKCRVFAFVPVLQYFTNYTLTETFLKFLCYQIAAARYTLKKNTPFDVFKGALGFEWAPFKVLDVFKDQDRGKYHIICKFLDGRPCGIELDLIQKNVGYRFYREAGLPKKLLRGVKLNPKDLVGFTYMALLQYEAFFPLDFTNSKVKRLDINAIAAVRCTGTQSKTNKEIFKERLTPCPFKLTNSCAQCFIGYDTCPRGCRSKTNWAATINPPMEILIHGR
jgi:hypothetical protein